MIIKKVNWNGFLKKCIKEYPKESVALIYTENPYTDEEIWHICPVKNVAKNPENNFKVDDKEAKELGKSSRGSYWNFIGSIHTHPYPEDIEFDEGMLQRKLLPSEKDLRSSKCRDLIVTGIIVCDNKAIYGLRFHSPFGKGEVDINLRGTDV